MEESPNEKNVQKSTTQQQQQQQTHSNSSSPMFCVKWNGFASQIKDGLASLFGTEELVDVTLASSDGQRIHAHKIVLAMSSPFFRRILKDNPCKHPIVIISGIKFQYVEHVIRFIYMGEVRMREDEIEDFIDAAESLKIDGISTVNQFDADFSSEQDIATSKTTTKFTTGVIKRNETPSTVTSSSHSSKPLASSPIKERNEFHAQDTRLPSYENISPIESQTVNVRQSKQPPNSNSTSPSWSPSYSSPGPSGSPWSSLVTPGNHHSNSHKAVMELFEIRTDSSSSSGQSPSVIVDMKDEAASISHSHNLPIPLSFNNRSGISEGDENLPAFSENNGRLQIKTEKKAYELSLQEPQVKSREVSPGSSTVLSLQNLIRPVHHAFPAQRSWPSEFAFPIHRTPHYLPLSLVAASAIMSSQPPPQRFLPVPPPSISMSVSLTTSPSSISHPDHLNITASSPSRISPINTSILADQQYRQQILSSRHQHNQQQHLSNCSSNNNNSSSIRTPSSLSALRAKLTASMFAHGNSSHFPKTSSRTGLNILSTKPRSRTTTIRSSQVPQSARYTAGEVDAMVERVDNFPGPLVPCTVCQKFVKRERLRAHIHECHLLQGESIICPHCGIGLKSKGSFRVHIWRHKRGSLGVKKLRDRNLTS